MVLYVMGVMLLVGSLTLVWQQRVIGELESRLDEAEARLRSYRNHPSQWPRG